MPIQYFFFVVFLWFSVVYEISLIKEVPSICLFIKTVEGAMVMLRMKSCLEPSDRPKYYDINLKPS